MRILVVEDEKHLNRIISEAVEDEGYSVDSCFNGQEALEFMECAKYDVMILDIMMPKLNGLDLVRRLRRGGDTTPVLFLTARDSVADRVEGLESGGDYYLVKPFDLDELSARIRALLRRSAGRSEPTIERGELVIKPETREVFFRGEPVLLSSKEYALLVALADRPGVVLSRGQLEEKLYNWDSTVGSNAIEVHVHHLRKKLSDGAIKTVRGVGYLLET